MAYVTARELRAVVPDEYRDAALADQGEQPEPGLLAAVIDQASREVDALIEGRVRLPLSLPYPEKIRTAALYFALEILFTRRGVDMPQKTAEKIAGIRTNLGKVGAGDLRLEAPAEQTAESRASSGSIVVRPSITGTGGMIGLILFLLAAVVRPASAVDARTYDFIAPTNPLIDSADYMEWSQAESVRLRYRLPAADATREARWEISDATNLWLNEAPVRSGAVWSWNPAPTQTCLPAGRYVGRVAVYARSGTNLTFHRILAFQDVRVHAARDPATLILASPLSTIGGEADPVFSTAAAFGITTNLLAQWNAAYGWGNHAAAGYLTSFTETDGVFVASAAYGITTNLLAQWNAAYGWGNHAAAGYLTDETDPVATSWAQTNLEAIAGLGLIASGAVQKLYQVPIQPPIVRTYWDFEADGVRNLSWIDGAVERGLYFDVGYLIGDWRFWGSNVFSGQLTLLDGAAVDMTNFVFGVLRAATVDDMPLIPWGETGEGASSPSYAENTPQALALADGYVTIWSTGSWEQAYVAAGAATVRVVKANATNSAALIWHATLSNHPTFFETNNLLGFTATGIDTNGGTSTVSLRSKPGTSNWTWSVDLP